MITLKWVEKKELPVSKEIQNSFSNPFVQQILARNQISSTKTAKEFINWSFYHPTGGEEIPDLEIAANRLLEAISKKEKIGIWGDFDVDGQTSTTLLYQGLKKLGANLVFYIPIRAKESHGIKIDSLKEFLKEDISVLLTCDTGISEHNSIQYAKQQGVDVLVTDHHSLPDTLPASLANVNPQRLPSNHPLGTLSGVGVAYKLIEFLFEQIGKAGECNDLLDLVALGTIADVALLTGDNRYLVQRGLELLQSPTRIGLQELYKIKRFGSSKINETHIGFYLAPMLNALGRLSDANQIVNFLTTNDLQIAKVFAFQLENLNERRKLLTEQITDSILARIDRNKEYLEEPSIIMHHPEWEAGVLGIVANRLVELFHKPTILLTGDDQTGYSGSARSIDSLNIIETIRASSTYLRHFGGHAMAAGMSMSADNYQNFKNNFNKTVLHSLGSEITEKELQIDGVIDFDVINLEFVREIEKLSPFGAGNPALVFASKNVTVENLRKIGRKSEHLKIVASDKSDNTQEFVWWRGNLDQIPEGKIDVAYNLHSTFYQGQETIQVEIVAVQPSETTLIELSRSTRELTFTDFRTNSPKNLDWLYEYHDFLWFQEGLNKNYDHTYNRTNLHPSANLILYTIPPTLSDFQKIYTIVQPEQIFLFKNYPLNHSINTIIKTVAGLLNHVISKKNGLFTPYQIAAIAGQRLSMVISICKYLHSLGQITLIEHPDTQYLIKPGGVEDKAMANLYKENIEFFHRETLSFYKWFSEASLETLNKSIVNL